MCLAIPAKIVNIHGDGTACVELGKVKKDVSVVLLDNPETGNYVLVHAGFALSYIDEKEAMQTLELFNQALLDDARGK